MTASFVRLDRGRGGSRLGFLGSGGSDQESATAHAGDTERQEDTTGDCEFLEHHGRQDSLGQSQRGRRQRAGGRGLADREASGGTSQDVERWTGRAATADAVEAAVSAMSQAAKGPKVEGAVTPRRVRRERSRIPGPREPAPHGPHRPASTGRRPRRGSGPRGSRGRSGAVFLRQAVDLLVDHRGALIPIDRRRGPRFGRDRRERPGRRDRSPVADLPPDRRDPAPRGNPDRDPVEPAPDRLSLADRRPPARQDQEGRLERVVHVCGIIEDVATDAHDHRPVPGHQGFERPLAALIPTRPEPLDQLPVGQTRAGPRAEEDLKMIGQRLRRCVWHDGSIPSFTPKVVFSYSAPGIGQPIQFFFEMCNPTCELL